MEQAKNCLRDLLDETTEKAKVGEFRKAAQAKLEELNGGVDAEEAAYRETRPGLLATWGEQDKAICEIQSHLESCYPNWKDYLDEGVCEEVIEKVWELRDKLNEKLGPPERCLDRANADLAAAADQLEAWKTIAAWITARLATNQALIDEICNLDNCTDRLFALYILYFELLPAHKRLEKEPSKLPAEFTDPEQAYCSDGCDSDSSKESERDQGESDEGGVELCGYPWLIDPDKYNCTLAKLWETWRDAGVAQAKAQCKFDQIAECRAEYEAAADPEAKREAAREALRRQDQKPCPPPPQSPPPDPSQQDPSQQQAA